MKRMASLFSFGLLAVGGALVLVLTMSPAQEIAQAFLAEEKTTIRVVKVHAVDIGETEFGPRILDVKPGDIIVWTNNDQIPHTVTADDESWDSQQIEPGANWHSNVTVGLRDTFYCRHHPSKKGRLNIAIKRRPMIE